MSKNVEFNVDRRPTKKAPGRTNVVLTVTGEDGDLTETTLGFISRDRGAADWPAFDTDGNHVGNFGTRSQAGHALQTAMFGPGKRGRRPGPTVTEVTEDTEPVTDDGVEIRELPFDEAVEALGISRGALQKRIRRGSIASREEDGVVLVTMPVA